MAGTDKADKAQRGNESNGAASLECLENMNMQHPEACLVCLNLGEPIDLPKHIRVVHPDSKVMSHFQIRIAQQSVSSLTFFIRENTNPYMIRPISSNSLPSKVVIWGEPFIIWRNAKKTSRAGWHKIKKCCRCQKKSKSPHAKNIKVGHHLCQGRSTPHIGDKLIPPVIGNPLIMGI